MSIFIWLFNYAPDAVLVKIVFSIVLRIMLINVNLLSVSKYILN